MFDQRPQHGHVVALHRATAVITGSLGGAGIGVLLVFDEIAAAGMAVVGALVLSAIALRLSTMRSVLLPLVSLAFSLRLFVLAAVHATLVVAGRGGHLLGDDATVADLAGRLAQLAQGQPTVIRWASEVYLLGPFVYFETGVFMIFGPQVAIVKVLNALCGVLLALVATALAARLFGKQAAVVAGVLTAFQPSLLLWSVLNLKDVSSALLVAVVVWLLLPGSLPMGRALVVAAVPYAILAELRGSLAIVIGWLAPVALLARPDVRLQGRLLAAAVCTLGAGLVLLLAGEGFLGAPWLHPQSLQLLEIRRTYGVLGARSAFATAPPEDVRPPVVVRPGARYLIFDVSVYEQADSSTTRSPEPTPSGRVLVTRPGVRLAIPEDLITEPLSVIEGREYLYVRGGDIVVVGEISENEEPPVIVIVRPGIANARQVVVQDDPVASQRTVGRLVAALPRGLAHAAGAPFPWSTRPIDRAVIPEMIVWYLALAAAAMTLWRERARWRRWALVAGFAFLMLLVLAAVEGNVGTLFRHRAVLQPFVYVLAAPTLYAIGLTSARTIARDRAGAPG